jgi:hypothetical protein
MLQDTVGLAKGGAAAGRRTEWQNPFKAGELGEWSHGVTGIPYLRF